MAYDFLVIGAGISGAAAAYELALHGRVLLLEAEAMPGYHATGRSAALFTRNYGVPVVRAINAASHPFFIDPPDGFAEHPLLTPRGALTVGRPGAEALLDPILALSAPGHEIVAVTAAEALALAPLLRPEHVAGGVFEAGVTDIDVAGLHQGFLRGGRRRGVEIRCDARVVGLQRQDGAWQVAAGGETVSAGIVVLAGARPIGLVPKRRTAIMVDPPPGLSVEGMPTVEFAGDEAYLKPDAGKIMASPGDQTPTVPQDAQPEEWDMAVLADWLQRHTTLAVGRVGHAWAGLRSFVADEAPVAGFDDDRDGFFWLAGQGGFGIMMAPALARAAAGLITGSGLPADLGLAPAALAPARLYI
jgi:D-arginine dehydrogenase